KLQRGEGRPKGRERSTRCIRHGLCCPTKRASRPWRTPGQRDPEVLQSPGGGGSGGALPQTPEQKYRLIYLSVPADTGAKIPFDLPIRLRRGAPADTGAKIPFDLPIRALEEV